MKQILCPIDYSDHSTNVLSYASSMAHSIGAALTLFHAFDAPTTITHVPLANITLDPETVCKQEEEKLSQFLKKNFKKVTGIKTSIKVAQGYPSEAICNAAEEMKVDMIIMGTTETSGFMHFITGSNASRVLHNACCPVLLVPHGVKFKPLLNITYATDLTDDNLYHVKHILEIARHFKSHLNILYINKDLHADIAKEEEHARKKVKEHVKYSDISVFVATGKDVSKEISNHLISHKSDCLVTYTHHYKIMQGIFKKSITSIVSHHTTIPLLVVHESR
jgi:nucleotide-binding universal stress UspA family protein